MSGSGTGALCRQESRSRVTNAVEVEAAGARTHRAMDDVLVVVDGDVASKRQVYLEMFVVSASLAPVALPTPLSSLFSSFPQHAFTRGCKQAKQVNKAAGANRKAVAMCCVCSFCVRVEK